MAENSANVAAINEQSAKKVLLVCFFFSGLTGLLYEIIWVRLFASVFGSTVYSVSAVLAAFMGGLGIGGWWFGRFIEKRKDSAFYYGLVEIAIGLYAFAPGWLIKIMEGLYPVVFKALGGSTGGMVVFKAVSAAIILALPTFCMGATLPLLSRFFVSVKSRMGREVAMLYGLNALGAVAGVFLTGFVLLSMMGIHDTLIMAMTVNIGIGLLALAQQQKIKGAQESKADENSVENIGASGDTQPLPLLINSEAASKNYFISMLLAATFISGFTSMLLEIAWTREMALVIGSSVFSFTLILLTFLCGISLGSLFAARYFKKGGGKGNSAGLAALGACFIIISISAAAGLPAVKYAVFYFLKLLSAIQNSFTWVLILQFFVSGVILIVPTMFFGAAFPISAALFSLKKGTVSSGVGNIYLWNTLGAIIGSLLTGFALIPTIGVHATLVMGILIMLAVGVALMAAETGASFLARAGAAIISAVFVGLMITTYKWDTGLMTLSPFTYAKTFSAATSLKALKHRIDSEMKEVFYKDGLNCTVSVTEAGNILALKVNGKTDASNGADASTQLAIGYIPMLLHGHAEKIAMIGMGSGMTGGAVLQFPSVKSLDMVEIEPGIIEAAKYFKDYNFNVLEDKRTKIHIQDGRNYFLADENTYDMIISEPSNLWMAGIANLYSQDYFKLAKTKLKKGGLYCQWVQAYRLSPTSVRMILATFQSVFPQVHVFMVDSDLIIIGGLEPLKVDAETIAERFDAIGLKEKTGKLTFAVSDYGITLAHYIAGPEEVRKGSAGSVLHTDDRPMLEFTAPFDFFVDTSETLRYMEDISFPDVFECTGLKSKTLTSKQYYYAGLEAIEHKSIKNRSEDFLKKAVETDPKNVMALRLIAYSYARKNLILLADEYYSRALDADGGKQARLEYADFLVEQKSFSAADNILKPLASEFGTNAAATSIHASILEGFGKYKEAAEYYIAYSALNDKDSIKGKALFYAAKMLKAAGNEKPSIRLRILRDSHRLLPGDPEITIELAKLLSELGADIEAYNVLVTSKDNYPNFQEIDFMLQQLSQSIKASGIAEEKK